MRRILNSLFTKSLQPPLCNIHKHNKNAPMMPYGSDRCLSCSVDLCHVCSDDHLQQHCTVKWTWQQLGTGVLRDFNMGKVMKVDLRGMRCICGKLLNRNAAICAACGLASCSEACHRQWEIMGNCTFRKLFQRQPQNATMRSIIFSNIHVIQKQNIQDWIIANKSGTNMITCYTSCTQPYVLFQRGFRIYGRPNDQFLERMQVMQEGLDTQTHYERVSDCDCSACEAKKEMVGLFPVMNVQNICEHYDLERAKVYNLNHDSQKQCTCDCPVCSSGFIMSTHRKIDCVHLCHRTREDFFNS